MHAQIENAAIDHTYKPLKLNLSEDGQKYMRFIMWHQFWGKFTSNNPGTVDINGDSKDSNTDFGLRRSRVLAFAQISPKFLILTHFGINNQQFDRGGLPGTNKKPQLYIHDAWTEYQVVKDKLSIGAGLHYFHGVSRLTNASTLNFMLVDAPIFNWPTIEATDQFARQFGIYAKGTLGKLNYQLAVNKPFQVGAFQGSIEGNPNVNSGYLINENASFAGYFEYQLFEKEGRKLPYRVGSYMAAKKVLNLGAGFYSHAESMVSTNTAGNEQIHNTFLLGIDVFANLPVNKDNGTAFTGYGVFYNYDFGDNHLRHIGIMPNGLGGTSLSGAGNRQPTIGTGTIFHAQFGYSLPYFGGNTSNGQLQPILGFTAKNFEALADGSTQFDVGMNYYINKHHAKITLQYSTRPIYNLDGTRDSSKGELILQTHIFL
ncbi:MAG: porin [Flammeovirgaceae bacterium]